MDAQNEVFPIVSRPPFYKNKLLIILFIILFQTAYTLVLFNVFRTKPQSGPVLSSEKMISENELPIGISLLKNPVVDQWQGGVEGSLVTKDETSITLSNKGTIITIPLYAPPSKEKMAIFNDLRLAKPGKNMGIIDLKDIPLGTYLRGSFFTIPSPDDKNKIVGGLFTVMNKAP